MGNYNPHAPYILGNEWVPIRQANYEPNVLGEHRREQGYTLQLDHAAAVVSGSFYVAEETADNLTKTVHLLSVYPAGSADQSGPIQRVVIPVTAVMVTGGTATGTVADLLLASDRETLNLSAGSPKVGLKFAVESYAGALAGKRIVDVRLIYTAGGDVADLLRISVALFFQKNFVTGSTSGYTYQTLIEGSSFGPFITSGVYHLVSFSDVNPITDTATSIFFQLPVHPWRYQELLRLSTAASFADSLLVVFNAGAEGVPIAGTVSLGYAALEVLYCEETRVLYGGSQSNSNFATSVTFPPGQNVVKLVDTNLGSASSLSPGNYLVTHTHRSLINNIFASSSKLSAIRQLYGVSPQRGVSLTVKNINPAPDEVFVLNGDPNTLTTLNLYTASGVVTGSHPYAEQVAAPVYGSITATQRIRSAPGNLSASLDQVRYYARRFGATTAPLLISGPGASATITPITFDTLPSIVDGWREVTLDLTSSVAVTGGAAQDWTWTAAGETAGNRWEVLGTRSFAVTGTYDPRTATYLAPDTSNVALTWKSPNVTGSTLDPWADATLILSQDPPMVSGFAVSVESQSITGIGQYCGSDSRCIPTAIQGLRLDWTPFGGCDDFNRDDVDTWNTSSSGIDWATSGGTPSNFYVNGVGNILLPTGDTAQRTAMLQATYGDFDQIVTMSTSQVATGASLNGQSRFRFQDANNYYVFSVAFLTSAQVSVGVFRVVGGVSTNIGTPAAVNIGTYSANKQVHTHVQTRGSVIRMKAWYGDRNLPPVNWQIEANDATFLTGQSGVRATQSAGNTNVNPVISFENFSVVSAPLYLGGQLEIQRRDPITDWQTIMLTEHPNCVTSFLDLEARVGQLSEYRIRTLNGLDFAGVWVTGSGTIPAPGVTVGGDGDSMLIMTSNQSPTASLAYTMQFEGQAVETFTFPEVDTLQLQRMFGKNFLTAFHPLERGGTQFTRVILVNAAAVALPSLEDFRNLRDLGWADLNYVCIRDELGNRWFANVAVPEGSVRMNRTIYLAEIRVTEVTDTPTPVDPSGGVG